MSLRTGEQALGLAGNGGSFFAPAVRVHPYTPNPYRCPSCGECYPQKGTCWGYGPDKHDPVTTERVDAA